ncbi:MAG TPA: phospho-N-acetylmuramoyl-pentapeptide-transferase [Syntrophomonadaceae bacterium]|nr:phospho-N-acetylmuramoyl-pentapeptide-transferase [Syntrophomonadaceae bacterium]HRX20292.1 phospho-N-acetylmuramoyl-pentapeptide-transferase [Syntrophomonadaceae bacterium]
MQEYTIAIIFAFLLAVIMCILPAPIMIPYLTRLKIGQNIRDDGPQRHLLKAGTPTMGGVLIITAVMIATFIMAGRSEEALTAVLLMLAFGGIGFWDDYIKVVLKRSLGLRAREKIGLQLVAGLLLSFLLLYYFDRGTTVLIPFTGQELDLGMMYIPFIIIVLIATANSVNLTDGLDGLASGVTIFAAVAFGFIAYTTAHYSLAVFCAALAGACAGFLVFNRYPARVFMGDTGSMALGGALVAVAALTGTEIYLLIIGGIFVIEALSDIIQVISFKATRKRVFLMAPIHHHFELKGWPETKVVKCFWLMALIFMITGMLIFYFTGLEVQ